MISETAVMFGSEAMTNVSTDGFQFECEVRETQDRGLGVFANVEIPKGRIVWRFAQGAFRVFDERSFTALIDALPRDEAIYELTHVFGLADFPDCLIRVLDAGALLNHSPEGNLATNFDAPPPTPADALAPDYLRAVSDALPDDRFALISTRDIGPGEELTNNYAGDVADPPFYRRLCAEYGVDEGYLDDESGV